MIENTIWLTGVSNQLTREAAATDLYGQLGVLLGPDTFGGQGCKADYTDDLLSYSRWGLDNGCFSNAGGFDEQRWLSRLAWIIDNVDGAHDSCLFAVAPDVFDPVASMGDPVATIQRSIPVLPKIRDIGVPAALVLQDGLELQQDLIPWGEFDVAFLGGSDAFKMGYPSFVPGFTEQHSGLPHYAIDDSGAQNERTIDWMRMIYSCYEHGVEVHVGRVNSAARLAFSQHLGAASADGTFFAKAGGIDGLNRVRRWFEKVHHTDEPVQQMLFAA